MSRWSDAVRNAQHALQELQEAANDDRRPATMIEAQTAHAIIAEAAEFDARPGDDE